MASMGRIEIEIDAELFDEIKRLRWALAGAESVLRIAASYDPDKWPTAGLKIHCQDAKVWADRAALLIGGRRDTELGVRHEHKNDNQGD